MNDLFVNLTRYTQAHAEVFIYDENDGFTFRAGGSIKLWHQSFIVNARGKFQFSPTTTLSDEGDILACPRSGDGYYNNRMAFLRIEV